MSDTLPHEGPGSGQTEAWLRGPVAAAYDAVMEGGAELLTPEAVRADLTHRADRRRASSGPS